MNFKVKISIRRDGYLAALALRIIERTLLNGINWKGPLLPYISLVSFGVDALITALLVIAFFHGAARSSNTYLKYGMILCLLAVSAWITKQTTLIYSAAFIILAEGIPFAQIRRVCYLSAMGSLLLLTACRFAGLILEQNVNFDYGIGNAMGMAHPNNLAATVAVVLLLWGYGKRRQNIWKVIPIVLGVSVITYTFTLSRTTLVIMVTYCLALILLALLEFVHAQSLIRIIRIGFVLLLAGSIWATMGSEAFFAGLRLPSNSGLNHLLSAMGRFLNASNLLEKHGIHLFGSYIEFRSLRTALLTGQEAVILDSAYMYLLINQGLVATIIYTWFFTRAMRNQVRAKQYVLLITMSVFMISCLMESYALDASMNFCLLTAFSSLETDQYELTKMREPDRNSGEDEKGS